MSYRDRIAFTHYVAKIPAKARELHLYAAYDYIHRCTDCKHNASGSLHIQSLAVDVVLYTPEGKYLRNTEAYTPLGEWWEGLGGVWGGRFRHPDGCHFQWGQKLTATYVAEVGWLEP